MKTIGVVCGILAFVFCVGAGLWLLTHVGLEREKNAILPQAIGFYFVGKGLFVGPMLILTAMRSVAPRS